MKKRSGLKNKMEKFKPMKDSKWILLIVIFVCVIVLFILIFPRVSAQNPRNDTLYIKTAEDIANSHTWIYKKYMCGNFAWDLAQSLVKEGYVVKIKEGRWFDLGNGKCSIDNYKRFKCYHYWILVKINGQWIPIESTGGYVIDPITYKRDYH
jgi:hypothetical protein